MVITGQFNSGSRIVRSPCSSVFLRGTLLHKDMHMNCAQAHTVKIKTNTADVWKPLIPIARYQTATRSYQILTPVGQTPRSVKSKLTSQVRNVHRTPERSSPDIGNSVHLLPLCTSGLFWVRFVI